MPELKQPFFLAPLLLHLLVTVSASSGSTGRLPSDAAALLSFKSKADLKGNLPFSTNGSLRYCSWAGVTCLQGRVVRLVVEGFDLGGVFSPDSLSRLDQLRVLSLQNNSLSGPIPDLSGLVNLKTLFLDHNSFSGPFPPSIFSLHRIRTVDLSHNNLTGPLPPSLTKLDRLNYLRLDSNRFNGTVPPLNQSSLQTFNVSGNDLNGAIPVTPVLSHFGVSSYLPSSGLCGEIVHKECRPGPPFFNSSAPVVAAPPPGAVTLGQSAELHGVNLTGPPPRGDHKRTPLIIGFSCGVLVLVGSVVCFVLALRRQRTRSRAGTEADEAEYVAAAAQEAALVRVEQEAELEEKVKRVQEGMMQVGAGAGVGRSGSLVFCAGEAHLYTLEQLMRASAELLGRGTVGTTYKAVLDGQLIVSVKRLDSGKVAGVNREAFEGHMEAVGGLRHPNLVPLRAYLQAKEERLLIYDYQPNGSLFSLIHGSKSSRAKPLHWTSCLKIAEDVAQGLSYIHQAWRLVHGNLKSSNVLLGPDFEACVSDYCLATLLLPNPLPPPDHDNDPNLLVYKAPETRHSTRSQPTTKSDVYAFGTLLLELLTSKNPSQHPNVEGAQAEEVMGWVRSTREDDGVGGDDRLGMLLEVALVCRLRSPEQRPTMWQVLKMLQEIKEGVGEDDHELDLHSNNGSVS
ncbi:probable inactive receptor kinase At5g67200 [Punica granatum]|uniref:Protein kinase domain-containing protein n=2 Tax=Punica granatum TaxID=22663 RepID=A0A218WES6_PUNGR|nr:probable inactive receptor kinase At5g67200 [Punica granatum]OWM70850.1 hypothetical protein CDL15_Pgr014523 [Punica granatum]PKI69706.1 hypothetical protein CRG98_009862 [Punica granatum]